MVSYVDHYEPQIAEHVYHLQQASYAVERDLIAYADFPPLRVTASELPDGLALVRFIKEVS